MRALGRFLYRRVASVLAGTNIERYGPIKRLNAAVTRLIRSDTVRINGFTMQVDPRDSMNLSILRTHEPDETALLGRELRTGDVAIDIGANIGYYTLLMAKLVGPSGHVYAFEPSSENAALLRHNVEINALENVTVELMAVQARSEPVRLFLSDDGGVDHRTYGSSEARSFEDADATTLDDYFGDRRKRVDFIKIDVQGSEDEVFRGMPGLIATNPRVKILTEFWPEGLVQNGVDPRSHLARIRSSGFAIQANRDGAGWRETQDDEILQWCTPENGRFLNLYCTRPSPPGRSSV